MTLKQPRGIRNNNPGNIRRSSYRWRGLAPADQQTDTAFFRFVDPVYGIRAMAIILLKYQSHYGLHTVRSVINRWAPPVENNTDAYAKAVSASLNIGPDDDISLKNPSTMYMILCAIIRHENGQQPYGRDVIMQAINMAGIR